MAKMLNMLENYPEFRDYLIYKMGLKHIVRAKTTAQIKKEVTREEAGLDSERIPLFEWIRNYDGQ